MGFERWLSFRVVSVLAVVAMAAAGCGGADATEAGSGAGPTGGGAGGDGGGGDGYGPPVCDAPGPASATPEARADHAGALAGDGRTLLVFGGDVAVPLCGSVPARQHVGETWLLDTGCGAWTQLGAAGPSARARHALSPDPARGRALLFGGRTRAGDSGPYTLFGDVWAFDFDALSWSELVTTGPAPSPRSNTAAVVVGDELWVFGGNASSSGIAFTPLDDLFALDLNTLTWREVVVTGGRPPARLFHAMAADAVNRRIYVHGGGDENAFVGPFLTDLWSLDLSSATWSPLAASPGGGVGRIKHGLAFVPGDIRARPADALVIFGGHDDGALGNRNDVLEIELGAEGASESPVLEGDTLNAEPAGLCDFPPDFTLVDLESPERRSAFSFAPTGDGAGFVVFGGDSDCGRLSDAHWFDARPGRWFPLRETLVGLVCPRTGSTTCQSLCN